MQLAKLSGEHHHHNSVAFLVYLFWVRVPMELGDEGWVVALLCCYHGYYTTLLLPAAQEQDYAGG